MVNISSFYEGCDDTCLLDQGDHPFVQKLSYVFYAEAKVCRSRGIQNGIDQGLIEPRPDLVDEIFERVLAGITVSQDTPQHVVRYFTQI